jgi:hypothetical protein
MPTLETAIPAYAIGVIAASALGGLIAMANMVVGKEQKTSEARKDWIDGLRTNLATFFARAQLLSLLWESKLGTLPAASEHPKMPLDEALKFRSEHKELYGQMLGAFHDVQLRLGTNTKEFETLITELDEIYKGLEGNTPDCHLQFRRKESSLRAKSGAAMKAEWEKVRDGERNFRIVKWFLYTLVLGIGLSAILVWIHM